jgi:hypothetical protein
MSHGILMAVFTAGVVFEIVGLLSTARDITVVDNHDGGLQLKVPQGWEAVRGPGLLIFGILIGLAGNILWLASPG